VQGAWGSVIVKGEDGAQGDDDNVVARLRRPWCPQHEGEAVDVDNRNDEVIDDVEQRMARAQSTRWSVK
jgi:hypothetical protein